MGILDDAIRQHLELKRRLGADESEIKELEDEAFGPPARPGDPDFPTGEEQAVAEAPPADESHAAQEPVEPATALITDPAPEAPAAEVAEVEPEAPVEEPPPPAPAPVEEPPEPEPAPEPEAAEPEPAAGADEAAAAESSFTTAEREAIADQPTVMYDRSQVDELEVGELDLDLEEELEDGDGIAEAPATGEEPLTGEEDVEAFTADEEALAEPLSDEAEVLESEVVEEDELEGELDEADAEPATGDEDVLEETPEFLRDNPDDDELWFEQGEPKDFDF
jgi:hypothetical protein